MLVTGYKLREALKAYELRRDSAASSFPDSLRKFRDEDKATPQQIVKEFLDSESAIAKLQVAQLRYNLSVNVTVSGNTMTLSEAVKRLGGPARAEKMWRSIVDPKKDRYDYIGSASTKDPSLIHSESTIDQKTSLKLAQEMAKLSGAYRAAIATANAQEVDIRDLSPELFE